MNLLDLKKQSALAPTASRLAMVSISESNNTVIRRRRRTYWAGCDGV